MDNIPFSEIAQNFLGQSLEGGIEVASQAVGKLMEMEQNSALGMSEFLHGVNYHWKEFDADMTFKKWANESTNYNTAVVQRKVCAWEWLTGEWIPGAYLDTIKKNFNTRMLSKAYRLSLKHSQNKYVGNYDFIKSGYDIEFPDWVALSECRDEPMLIGVIDDITDREPNANRVSFGVSDNGELVFYRGKKDQAVIGSLSVGSDSSLVKDGVSEALKKLGVEK
jgi:hypothetical protein